MRLRERIPFTNNLLMYTLMLILIEFARGAVLLSYIQNYAVDQLRLSLWAVGIAVTAHYVADTVLKLFIGYLLDRFRMKWVLHIGFLLSLVGLFLLQNAEGAFLFILGSAIFGVGTAPMFIACMTQVQPENRASQMGLLYTGWLAGLGLGPIVLNFLLDVSYALAFWFIFSAIIAAWLVTFTFSSDAKQSLETMPFGRQVQLLISRIQHMKALVPGMILQTLGASMLVPGLPKFASEHLGLTNSQYSLVLLIGGGASVVAMVPMGKLCDRFGKKWFLSLGFVFFAISLYGLTSATSIWLCLLWALVLGLSYASVLPAWNALLAYYIPVEQKGTGWGMFSTIEGVGVMLGPIIGGALATAFGLTVPVIVSAIVFSTIGLFYFIYPLQGLKKEDTPQT